MSQIDLFAEVEGLRSYQQDRNAVELPSPMESGGDDKARIEALEQQVRRFQEFIEQQNAVEIPEGPGLDRSYEFTPNDDKPLVAGPGISIVDTGRQVFVGLDTRYETVDPEVVGGGVGGGGGGDDCCLPPGGTTGQVLRKASDADWDVEWAGGDTEGFTGSFSLLSGAAWNGSTKAADFPATTLSISGGLITGGTSSTTISIAFAECDDT